MVLFDEREDLVRDGLVDAAEREHFRHMALAFEPHHRRAVTNTILGLWTFQLAKLIVYGDGLCRHAGSSGGVNIQFAPGQCNGRTSGFESIQNRKGWRCRSRTGCSGCLGRSAPGPTAATASGSTTSASPTTAASACTRGRRRSSGASGNPLLAVPPPWRRSSQCYPRCCRTGSLVGQ